MSNECQLSQLWTQSSGVFVSHCELYYALQSHKLYFQLNLRHRAASSWALPHISSYL